MRGDARPAFGQAHPLILCAEHGLHFAKEGDHWRCVERPDLVMLPGPEHYRVGGQAFATLDAALAHCARAAQGVWESNGV